MFWRSWRWNQQEKEQKYDSETRFFGVSCKLCQGAVAGVSVEDERVRELLGRVNGIDMDVVFAARKEPLVPPRYRLMTRDQLPTR